MKRIFCLLSAATLLLTGCSLFENWKKDAHATTLSIHEQVPPTLPAEHLRNVEIPTFDLKVSIDPYPALTQLQINTAEAKPVIGGIGLLLRFDAHGTSVLQQITTESRGKYLVFFLNQRPVSAWLVDHSITNGEFLLEGYFTDEEAKEAARSLTDQGRKRNRQEKSIW